MNIAWTVQKNYMRKMMTMMGHLGDVESVEEIGQNVQQVVHCMMTERMTMI